MMGNSCCTCPHSLVIGLRGFFVGTIDEGEESGFSADFELAVDIGQVLFDRLVRDKESLSDVRAILSGQDQVDNLFFPLGDGELFDAIGEILVQADLTLDPAALFIHGQVDALVPHYCDQVRFPLYLDRPVRDLDGEVPDRTTERHHPGTILHIVKHSLPVVGMACEDGLHLFTTKIIFLPVKHLAECLVAINDDPVAADDYAIEQDIGDHPPEFRLAPMCVDEFLLKGAQGTEAPGNPEPDQIAGNQGDNDGEGGPAFEAALDEEGRHVVGEKGQEGHRS